MTAGERLFALCASIERAIMAASSANHADR